MNEQALSAIAQRLGIALDARLRPAELTALGFHHAAKHFSEHGYNDAVVPRRFVASNNEDRW